MDECPHDFAVRFYAGSLSHATATTGAGKTYRILNLPYYSVSRIEEYISKFK